MGAVRFSIDTGLVRELQKALPLKVFVETGTYEGASVRAALPLFEELHTIELSATLYAHVVEGFEDVEQVHVYHGRSEDVLRQLAPKLKRKSVLYWLDAHWSNEEHSEGADDQCPLLEELEAIGTLDPRSVVLIDDARLFLAPPPVPAPAEGWPELSQVLNRLSALSSTHELLVIDDVIVFFPPQVSGALRDYARHHAVDWLAEIQNGRRVDAQLERVRSEVTGFRNQAANQQRARSKHVTERLNALAREIREFGEHTAFDELPKARSEIASLSEHLEALRTELDLLRPQLDDAEGRRAESSSATLEQLRALSEQVQSLGTELGQIEARSQESRAALEELPKARGEIGSLAERVDAMRSDLDGLQPKLDQAEGRRSESSEATLRELRALSEQVQSVERRLEAASVRRGPIAALRRRRSASAAPSEATAPRKEKSRSRPGPVSRGARRARRRLKLMRRGIRRGWRRLRRGVAGALSRVGQKLWGPRLGSVDHHPPRELRVPKRYHRRPDLEQPPLISIVTASDSNAPVLERTIMSVLDQDYERLEYIVEDAAPTRQTAKILHRYEGKLAHSEGHPDSKPSVALNLGFEHATGDVLSSVGSDALLLPGTLPYVARYFERHPEVDVVYGHRVLVDEADHEIGRWVLPRHDDDVLPWAHYIPASSLFWRRRVWEASGGEVDEDLREAMDWELMLRFREVGARMARVPRFLGAIRVPDPERLAAHRAEMNGNDELRQLRARVHGREVGEDEARKAVRGYMRRHVMLQKLYRMRVLRY